MRLDEIYGAGTAIGFGGFLRLLLRGLAVGLGAMERIPGGVRREDLDSLLNSGDLLHASLVVQDDKTLPLVRTFGKHWKRPGRFLQTCRKRFRFSLTIFGVQDMVEQRTNKRKKRWRDTALRQKCGKA